MKNVKKSIFSILLILILLIYPTVNGLEMYASRRSGVETETDTQFLSSLSEGKTEEVRQNISRVQNQLASEQEQFEKKEILDKLDKGKLTYRNLFKNVYIMGDSLMNGLEAYNILNNNNLITQVSASLYHLNDNVDKMAQMSPEILILHYGLNHIENVSHQPARFIKFYSEIITELKEKLPGTRIIVSGIFPVDTEKARAKRFGRIDEYNQALEEMCSQLGVEFLDNTAAFVDAEEYYAGDGIHLSRDFYENCWLRHIVSEKEIYK